MAALPLISTVGPVEPALLDAFISHYEKVGVDRFLIALHFPEPTDAGIKADLHATCRTRVGEPEIIVEEPWHEQASDPLRDELRRRAGPGWHLLTDADEFQQYPGTPAAAIDAAVADGSLVVGGVLLDRVTADGSLAGWSPEIGLDNSYPLGGFLTAERLGGNPRKIVLAHSDVREISTGNHTVPNSRRAPGLRPTNIPIVIHHFKWREGVLDYLRRRVEMLASGVWREIGPAPREEATRLLAHVADHDGRIDVTDPLVPFRPVSMDSLPLWWSDESLQLRDSWPPRIARDRCAPNG